MKRRLVPFIIFFVGLMFLLVAQAKAEQKYNPFSGQWETTHPESQLQYNPFDNSWQYVTPPRGRNSRERDFLLPAPQYNPFNNKWEFPR